MATASRYSSYSAPCSPTSISSSFSAFLSSTRLFVDGVVDVWKKKTIPTKKAAACRQKDGTQEWGVGESNRGAYDGEQKSKRRRGLRSSAQRVLKKNAERVLVGIKATNAQRDYHTAAQHTLAQQCDTVWLLWSGFEKRQKKILSGTKKFRTSPYQGGATCALGGCAEASERGVLTKQTPHFFASRQERLVPATNQFKSRHDGQHQSAPGLGRGKQLDRTGTQQQHASAILLSCCPEEECLKACLKK